ncbi:hypothetical protein AC578_3849 [Pseudocercospora eumusae]|uniref:Uncharacterized protein n=1 Tax=Pseudocercospora eumusae TaxID=321146 RepID=A0A139GX27_9PEZI|nr:hypothetical protein AC578_3849 [Pseudocercospora eumusae]
MNLLEGADIPLHCNVCPKKPDFSDVSHLLTHIQSKGHLSAQYKVSVKANHDAEAKQLMEDYNEWYQKYNLDDLMHERLSQKEKKSRSGNGAARRSSAAKSNSARSTPSASNNAARRQSRLRTQQHLLDPQLNRRLVTDPLSRSVTPGNGFIYNPTNFQNFAAPPLQNWAFGSVHDSPLSNSIKQESVDSDYYDEDDEDEDYDIMAPVTRARRVPYPKVKRSSMSGSIASYIKEEDVEEENNANIAPKGIQWPGMLQFDSATPEQKRRRNQKKHASVLIGLQRASERIAPVEMVFDKDGALRKERDVNLPLSDDDLISGESAPEDDGASKRPRKKKSATTRAALRNKDANSGRITRGRANAGYGRTFNDPYYGGFGDADNDDITYRARAPRIKQEKRSGISIHRDNTGPEITFDQPANMNFLTSGFLTTRPPPSAEGPFVNQRVHSRSTSWGQMNTGFRPSSSGYNSVNPSPGYAIGGMSGGMGGPFGNTYGVNLPAQASIVSSNQANASANNTFVPNPLFGGGSGGMWDMFGNDMMPFNFGSNGSGGDMKDGTFANPLFLKEDSEVTLSAQGSEK